ncbi:hypothetical protein IBE33_09460 [Francisella philomiragia]|uniref:hypothetical protein n=1 Tax=Francisella philomiragia TaxID=28110 RepID=UPI001902D430|nr:hypothetical protein [Francisella philomiragia]MBK2341737.1 hypothetical protein [Francisella philomiragia]
MCQSNDVPSAPIPHNQIEIRITNKACYISVTDVSILDKLLYINNELIIKDRDASNE